MLSGKDHGRRDAGCSYKPAKIQGILPPRSAQDQVKVANQVVTGEDIHVDGHRALRGRTTVLQPHNVPRHAVQYILSYILCFEAQRRPISPPKCTSFAAMTGTQAPSQEEDNEGIVPDQNTSQFCLLDLADEPNLMFNGLGGVAYALPGTTTPPDFSSNNDAWLLGPNKTLEPNIADWYMLGHTNSPWNPALWCSGMTGGLPGNRSDPNSALGCGSCSCDPTVQWYFLTNEPKQRQLGSNDYSIQWRNIAPEQLSATSWRPQLESVASAGCKCHFGGVAAA